MNHDIKEQSIISNFTVPVDGIERTFRLSRPMVLQTGSVLEDIVTKVSSYTIFKKSEGTEVAYPTTIELCFKVRSGSKAKTKKHWRYAELTDKLEEIFS